MTWRIAVGTLLTLATIILVTFWAVNEPARMTQYIAGFEARQVEYGAELYSSNCATCHGENGLGIPGRAPALNNPALFNGQRLEEIGWSGTTYAFIELTVAAGRPVMSAGESYPEVMPTWSQEYGGPMRPDQVRAVSAFVMNFEADALASDTGSAGSDEPDKIPVGTDLDIELPDGDPERGQLLFAGSPADGGYACNACHSLEPGVQVVGPSIYGVATRAETRVPGYEAARYLHESIVLPNAYVVEGFVPNLMPAIYADQMDAQELADIIAYLLTLTE